MAIPFTPWVFGYVMVRHYGPYFYGTDYGAFGAINQDPHVVANGTSQSPLRSQLGALSRAPTVVRAWPNGSVRKDHHRVHQPHCSQAGL